MAEPVAGAKVELGVGVEGVTAGLDKAGKAFAKWQKDVQSSIDKIQGSKPTFELQKIDAALQKMGGTSKLSEQQLASLQKRIESLTAAGGKLPAALQGLKMPAIAPSLDLSKLGGALKGVGQAEMSSLAASAGPLGGALTALGPAGLAAAAGVGALTAAAAAATSIVKDSIQSFVAYGSKITDLSEKTKLSVGFIQDLDSAASLVGGNFETVAEAAQVLTQKIGEGDDVFERLGFSLKELNATAPDERFRAIGAAILAIEDPTRQAALGTEVFGKKWREVEVTIRTAISGAASDMPNLSDAAIKAADDFGDQITKMEAALERLKRQFGAKFVEGGGLLTFVAGLTAEINNLGSAIANNKGAITGFFKTIDSVFMGGGGNAIIEQLQKTGRAAQLFEDMRQRRAGEVAAATEFAHEALGGARVPQTQKEAAAAKKASEEAAKAAKELAKAMFDIDHETQAILDNADKFEVKSAENLDKAAAELRAAAMALEEKLMFEAEREATQLWIADLKELQAELEEMDAAGNIMDPDEVAGPLGSEITSATEATKKLKAEMDKVADSINAAVSALGVLGDFLENIGAGGSKLAEVVGGLQKIGSATAKGAQAGAAFGPIGMAIGGALGAVGSIVSLFKKPEFESVMKDVGKRWGVAISEGLAKQIEEFEKKFGLSRGFAELLNLDDIIDESGMDPAKFSAQINSLMEAVALGSVPAKEGIAELGDAFEDLQDAAEGGSLASEAAMIQMIRRSRELGQSIPAIDAALEQFLDDAVAGFEKFLANVMPGEDGSVSAEQAAANQQIFGVLFEAETAQLGVVGAAERMQKAFDDLVASLPPGTVLTGPMARAAHVIQLLEQTDGVFKGAAEAAAGLAATLEGLVKSDMLTQGTVDAFGTSTQTIFDQALGADGATRDDAFQAILPLLNELAKAQALGATLDPKSAALLAEAQSKGIVPMLDPLVQQVGLQRQMVGLLSNIAGVSVPGVPGGGADSGGGTPTGPDKGMAAGGVSIGPLSGYWQKLHGTEAVIPMTGGDGIDSLRSAHGAGGGNALSTYVNVSVDGSYGDEQTLKRLATMLNVIHERNIEGQATTLKNILTGSEGR